LDLDLNLKKLWTVFGLGLSLKKLGVALDCKLWQSPHLWFGLLRGGSCSGDSHMTMHARSVGTVTKVCSYLHICWF